MIHLRKNYSGQSAGLSGEIVNILKYDDTNKVLAYERKSTDKSLAGDSTMVIINFSNKTLNDYQAVFPTSGNYAILLNSDWQGYSPDFGGQPANDIVVNTEDVEILNLAPYSVLIYGLK